jgi:serine/threonine protein kinase
MSPAAPSTLLRGRFELRSILLTGALATVWRGFDLHLEREVSVELFNPSAFSGEDELQRCLQDVRRASRLTHQNIVPVFEVSVHDGQPFVICEYDAAQTLADVLRAQGAFNVPAVVSTILGILAALDTAHQAGVVHRDLNPSSVRLDAHGRVRVTGFGIAIRVGETSRGTHIHGTPGYLSPEAAQGSPPSPSMDIFATGLLMAELLAGKPVIPVDDPQQAIDRVAHEEIGLPTCISSADADDALCAIVLRALALDPTRRFASAEAFSQALQGWAQSAHDAGGATDEDGSPALDFLLRRMRHRSDFPALSDAVNRIQRVANSETENLNSLANEILKDVALTNKLLRLVNTVSFRHGGTGTISTVSRAAALVGFAGIRNMALSLMLLEHMHDKAHAGLLKDEFVRSLMAGTLAAELYGAGPDGEEAFIGSMFQNLGRLLTEFYFPEEARQIRVLVGSGVAAGDAPRAGTERAASVQVLGLDFEDLGVGVARSWGLPDTLQRCMRRPLDEPPTRPPETLPERLRWLAMAANDLTDTLLRCDPAASSVAINRTAERYARVLGCSARQISEATAAARFKLADSARAMNLSVPGHSPAARLLAPATDSPEPVDANSLAAHALRAAAATPAEPGEGAQAADILAAGIHDITDSMVENFKLNELLRMILETMFRALRFQRVVFCLRDPKIERLTGRFGLGADVNAATAAFKIDLKESTDLFAVVCMQGADTLIRDATTSQMVARLPAWYRNTLNAPSFLLLPLMLKGAPFALIYADQATAGGIELGEKELALLRTLRNQAVMAFRQAT